MPEYIISSEMHEESNEEQVAVTCKVNGLEVAFVLNARRLPKVAAARRKVLDEAAIDAYVAKTEARKQAQHPSDHVVVR